MAHQLARAAAALFGRWQIRHGDGAPRLDGNRHLREQFARIDARQAAEVAVGGAVDADGHDGGTGFGGYKGGAVVHLHQRAGFGDAPFGKDHDRPTGFHQLDDLLHGQRAGRIHHEVRHEAQQKRKQGLVGNL